MSGPYYLLNFLNMTIELKKFGTTLISRQAGREAFLAFQHTLNSLKKDENLEIDFIGVLTFSPSWGDEFLTPLLNALGDRLVLKNLTNPSVKATLDFLEMSTEKRFRRR